MRHDRLNWTCKACAAALTGGLLVATATADLGESAGTGNSGVTLASEVIGTLPTFWVEEDIALVSMATAEATELQHDLHIETIVPIEQLTQFVETADGEGYVFLTEVADFDGAVRVRFYGDVEVQLRREVVGEFGLPIRLEFGAGNAGGIGAIEVDSVVTAPFALDGLGSGLAVPFGSSPTFDALFEQSNVRFYSVAEEGAGFDVGAVDVSVDADHYGFELTVADSLMP